MQRTPGQIHGLFKGMVIALACLCYGCASATPQKPEPATIFTQAAGTAAAWETSIALTSPPLKPAEKPTLTEKEMTGAVVPDLTQVPASPTTGIDMQATSTATIVDAQTASTATPPPAETATQANTPETSGTGAACIPTNPPQTGKVLDILDGDTIKVMIDGKTFTVRYIGIDAPEYIKSKDFYSNEARLKNSELVFAKEITLYADGLESDEVGRLLRYVKVGETFVNLELVNMGYAKVVVAGANNSCDAVFQSAQDQAGASKKGLWSQP